MNWYLPETKSVHGNQVLYIKNNHSGVCLIQHFVSFQNGHRSMFGPNNIPFMRYGVIVMDYFC